MATLKKLILHGEFKERYRGEYNVYADTAAEVLESFQAQCNAFTPDISQPRARLEGRIRGFDTREALYTPTDIEEIHLESTPFVGGKKGGFFQIIIGAVLIAVAVIAPFGMSAAYAAAFATAGIGMVAGGVINLLMPVPSLASGEDPSASKYLGADRNTVKIGTRIPLMYGTGPAYGHILSFNTDSTSMLRGSWPTV